jgi:hypothetical protein
MQSISVSSNSFKFTRSKILSSILKTNSVERVKRILMKPGLKRTAHFLTWDDARFGYLGQLSNFLYIRTAIVDNCI